jgi:hypothetical protein
MLFTVTFGGFYPSTPAVGYTIYNADGSLYQARTVAGVVNPVGNVFQVNVTASIPNPCSVIWDDASGNYAATAYNGAGTAVTTIVNDNLMCG